MSVASLFTPCFVMFCVFLYGPFCHGAHKLDLSTLFTTFFLWTSPPFILSFTRLLIILFISIVLSYKKTGTSDRVHVAIGWINSMNNVYSLSTLPFNTIWLLAPSEDLNHRNMTIFSLYFIVYYFYVKAYLNTYMPSTCVSIFSYIPWPFEYCVSSHK